MHPVNLDRAACYRALQTRDPRFDGRFFVAVRTTGIYCRPICPAPCPKLANIAFHRTAASAHEAGFRPCLRCRPESAPEVAASRGTSSTVARALARIAEGALDGDHASVAALAERLGIGERQLRRLFDQHLGASPIAVAQSRRVLLAKQLLHETQLKMIDVAFAAGFGSLRRFNDTFRGLYGRPPTALRRDAGTSAAPADGTCDITLSLSYVPPYDWEAIAQFFAARAIPSIEIVEPRRYRRTVTFDGCTGTIDVAPLAGRHALSATIRFADIRSLPSIIARIRNLFDVGSDVAAIAAQFSDDAILGRLVAARPGLRVPGAWDPFELAVRAVLGQQITVAAARLLAAKLVAAHGEPLAHGADTGLTRTFPTATHLATADLSSLGLTRARAATLRALAAAAASDGALFAAAGDLDATVARLRQLPGIGEWTAQYIALRALREPDAFPAADAALLRALSTPDGVRPTPTGLLAIAARWRPWRAYAAQHLWSRDAAPTRAARWNSEAVA